jgi:hypothetical protein
MRLALIIFYAHFFINGMLAHPVGNQSINLDVTSPRCTQVLQPLIIIAQTYDIINTRNQLARYPHAREVDWWSSRFAGPQRRNVAGIALGIALLDVIKWKLTAHSPALRCAVEANQLETTIQAIRVTHR